MQIRDNVYIEKYSSMVDENVTKKINTSKYIAENSTNYY